MPDAKGAFSPLFFPSLGGLPSKDWARSLAFPTVALFEASGPVGFPPTASHRWLPIGAVGSIFPLPFCRDMALPGG